MSGYFARLVQRASGREQRTSAIPVLHSSRPGSDAHDPFEATAPLEFHSAPRAPEQPVSAREQITASFVPAEIPLKPISQTAPTPPEMERPVIPRQAGEPVPIPPTIARPAEDRMPAVVNNLQQDTEIRNPGKPPVIEHQIVTERLRPLQPPSMPPAVPHVAIPRPPVLAVAYSASPPEKPSPTPQPALQLNQPAVLKERQPLDPVQAPHIVAPAPLPEKLEEPRMVIGRMHVEVVPTAPVPPPRRISGRRLSAPREIGPSSRLHFGLGQM